MKRTPVILLAAGLLAGCAGQARTVDQSGFLANYSRLEPGGKGDPIEYYVKPGLDLSNYAKIEIEPVMIRASTKDALKSVPKDELEYLVKLFYDAVRDEIGSVKQIVSSAGPGTMRLRLAITEIRGREVGDEVVSVIHPVGIVANVGSLMATGTTAWASRVSIEGELSDSVSGDVLVEFVDRRDDGEAFEGGRWAQAEKALRFWAAQMRKKVKELSGADPSKG